jgi:FKBP-type peptidyl-prolyl cis-trans isomerase FkpA
MIRKNYRIIIPLLGVILILSVVSCDPSNKLAKQEEEDIQTYLTQNSQLNFIKKTSGLYYYEVVAGTGISPVTTDSAYIKYVGKFLNGNIFESNVASGKLYGFKVGERTVTGISEGVTLMKAGGKSTLLIPSKLAYGPNGKYPYIQGYTPLLFDIELVKVVPHTGK